VNASAAAQSGETAIRSGGGLADAATRTRLAAEQLASKLPALLAAVERVASTVAQGVHGRRRAGQGETFWQFRRYMPGDTIDRIDWRQTAKSAHVYVRETEWEAAQTVYLWLDRSPSMDWASDKRLPAKQERAELLLLALAALLARGGERVALLGTGAPPAHGKFAVNRLAELLLTLPAVSGGLPRTQRLPRYAGCVLFGDLLSPLEEIDARVKALAGTGVRGHLVHIVDPAEAGLPYSGRTRFEGLEDDGALLVSRVESVRDDYLAAFENHVAGLRAIARAYGWIYHQHRTDRGPELPLMSLWLALAEAAR
jgi:uncharacterized protein (DUF58 family)